MKTTKFIYRVYRGKGSGYSQNFEFLNIVVQALGETSIEEQIKIEWQGNLVPQGAFTQDNVWYAGKMEINTVRFRSLELIKKLAKVFEGRVPYDSPEAVIVALRKLGVKPATYFQSEKVNEIITDEEIVAGKFVRHGGVEYTISPDEQRMELNTLNTYTKLLMK